MPNNYKLFKFQSEGIDWLSQPRTNNYGFTAEANCGLLGDEMGLGKTAQALRVVEPLVRSGKRILILVPGATVIQWQRNWDRWILNCEPDEFGMDGLYAVRASDSKIPRGMSCIASHQMMAKHDFVQNVISANFDGLILDEGHKFGGRDTKRIKHLWALRNVSASHFESCRIVLTGTPVRNYADEIYNLLHFIAPAQFRNFEDFARKYLTRDHKALWNPSQFHSDIRPFYIRRTVAEVQKDLPPSRKTKLYTEITDKFIREAYNKELDVLDNFMNNAERIDSMSLLGYLVKLRHITGIAKAKEPAIIEPIVDYLLAPSQRNNDQMGNKVAIGLIHRLVADRLERSLRAQIPTLEVFRIQGGMTPSEKDRSIQDFQSCSAPAVILCNMEAGGAGIDGLQNVCNQSYIFERMWNGADEEQFEKRTARTGQKFACEACYTMTSGTIEEFFDDLVELKRSIAGGVVDENWQSDPKFIRQLAEKVCMNRLV